MYVCVCVYIVYNAGACTFYQVIRAHNTCTHTPAYWAMTVGIQQVVLATARDICLCMMYLCVYLCLWLCLCVHVYTCVLYY